jgi:hypothetical protein
MVETTPAGVQVAVKAVDVSDQAPAPYSVWRLPRLVQGSISSMTGTTLSTYYISAILASGWGYGGVRRESGCLLDLFGNELEPERMAYASAAVALVLQPIPFFARRDDFVPPPVSC